MGQTSVLGAGRYDAEGLHGPKDAVAARPASSRLQRQQIRARASGSLSILLKPVFISSSQASQIKYGFLQVQNAWLKGAEENPCQIPAVSSC